MTRTVICCGAGGVGKTTISAALSLRFASEGRAAAVLTIDPARRLADSLGIERLGNVARPVRLPPGVLGRLDALMLDASSTFNRLVERLAPNPTVLERILANRYYQFISTRLAGVHEYMAIHRLQELVEDGTWEVVVLDTPPTRHAVDFLTAPDRAAAVMDQGVLRVLSAPSSSAGLQSILRQGKGVMKVLDHFIGMGTIREIGEFVASFEGMTEGFRERFLRVRALLRSRETVFVLVTSPVPSRITEALEFHRFLVDQGFPFGGFIVNRVTTMPEESEPVGSDGTLPVPEGMSEATWSRWVDLVNQAPEHFAWQARRDEESIAWLRDHIEGDARLWIVPAFGGDVDQIAALLELGRHLPGIDEIMTSVSCRQPDWS